MDGDRAGKLLLVEDEHVLRRLIAQFLRTERFEVIEAADGAQGVEHYLCQGPFDVVLLDLNLPRLSGVEVCRRIRAASPTQPVIICSAAILDDHMAALNGLNVERCLTKPCHPLELLRAIHTAIARAGGEATDEAEWRPWQGGRTPRIDTSHCEPRQPASARALVKPPILD